MSAKANQRNRGSSHDGSWQCNYDARRSRGWRGLWVSANINSTRTEFVNSIGGTGLACISTGPETDTES